MTSFARLVAIVEGKVSPAQPIYDYDAAEIVRDVLLALQDLEPLGPVAAAGQWAWLGRSRTNPPVMECVEANEKAVAAFKAMVASVLATAKPNTR